MKPSGFGSGFGGGFGVGRYHYELVPWQWLTSPRPHWALPFPVVGRVDLRPLAAQAMAGGSPVGFAFVASMQPLGGHAIATSLHFNDEGATSSMQNAWQSALGYRPTGARVVDLLWDQLTTGADPDGEAGPKPLMPGTDGFLRLFVGGHSPVRRERFRWGVHPHTNRVQAVLQRDFERMWEHTNGHDNCRRCLDFTCKKYRVEDWKEFVPARLRAHVPGRLPHHTTITESFNTADSDTLGPDLSWTEVAGDWDVVSNRCQYRTATAGAADGARADSDLSSEDHYGQTSVISIGSGTDITLLGPTARFAAAASTFYYCFPFQFDDNIYIGKQVAGTDTNLSNTAITLALPELYKCEIDGSTLKGYQAGVERVAATDSAISGNTRCGLVAFSTTGIEPICDSFEAADLDAGGGGVIYTQLERYTRGLTRGLYTGGF